jgi:hypothetical protein
MSGQLSPNTNKTDFLCNLASIIPDSDQAWGVIYEGQELNVNTYLQEKVPNIFRSKEEYD